IHDSLAQPQLTAPTPSSTTSLTTHNSPQQFQISRCRLRSVALVDDVEIRPVRKVCSEQVDTSVRHAVEGHILIIVSVRLVDKCSGTVKDLHIVVREVLNTGNLKDIVFTVIISRYAIENEHFGFNREDFGR